jgi:hypothetical protein
MMADVVEVEVVVAHRERATLRVGEVFLKIDVDQAHTDVEVEAMAMAPVPTRRSCGGSRPCSPSPPSQGRHSAASNLGDIVAGYGSEVDLDVIHAWWSWRSLVVVRWLAEHGFGPLEEMPEVGVLRSRL